MLATEPGPATIIALIREVEITADHWYLWPNQGTRVAGNLCHWIDLAFHLLGPGPRAVEVAVSPRVSDDPRDADAERAFTITFDDGSVATLMPTTRGDSVRGVQEQIEIRRGGLALRLDDLWRLNGLRRGLPVRHRTLWRGKGHGPMYRSAIKRFAAGDAAAYPAADLRRVGEVQLAATEAVRSGAAAAPIADLLAAGRAGSGLALQFDDPESELGRVAVEAEVAADAGTDADDVQKVLSRGSIYSIVTVVQAASVLLAIPLLTRLLDADEYGMLTAVLVAQAVLTHLAGFGMPSAVTRAYFHESGPDGARALIGAAAAVAFAVAVVAIATGPLWSQVFGTLDFGPELALAVVSAALSATLVSAQMVLQAEGRARGIRHRRRARDRRRPAQRHRRSRARLRPDRLLGRAQPRLPRRAALRWPTAGFRLRPLRAATTRRPLVTTALRVGLPTIWVGLSLYLLSAADRVVVERIEGAAAAGNYYIAYAAGSLAIFLVAAINGAWSPAIFGAEKAPPLGFLADSAVAITRIAALAAAALTLAAPLVLRLLAPADYDVDGLGGVSLLVAVSAIPTSGAQGGANLAVWRARTGRLAVSSVAAVVLNLVLCALLVRPLGLEGRRRGDADRLRLPQPRDLALDPAADPGIRARWRSPPPPLRSPSPSRWRCPPTASGCSSGRDRRRDRAAGGAHRRRRPGAQAR